MFFIIARFQADKKGFSGVFAASYGFFHKMFHMKHKMEGAGIANAISGSFQQEMNKGML